jgi:hypothetical protein
MIEPIAPDTSRTFRNPYSRNIIRTGTIGDGSCFFHALLYALFSHYRGKSIPDRIAYVESVRNAMSDSLTIERWKTLGNGEMYKMQIIQAIREGLLVSNPEFEARHLSTVANEWTSCELGMLQHRLESALCGGSPLDVHRFVCDAEQCAFDAYREQVRTQWVDDTLIELISEQYKCNIHFIQASTRCAYRTLLHMDYPHDIVMCWIDDAHYECLGQLTESGHAKRIFCATDPFIAKLKCHED